MAEIRGYIKAGVRLGKIFERNFQRTVWCVWKQVFVINTGLQVRQQIQNLKDKQRPRAPRTASTDAILPKITDIISHDGRLTIKQITNIVGISSGTIFTILKKHLGLRKVSARWIPHLLTEKQIWLRVEVCRKLLKIYKNCKGRVYRKLLQVMKHPYIILNLRGKLITRCGWLKNQ